MAPSLSGAMVCAVHTSSNNGFSICGIGSEPTITAAAPSPNSACPTRLSRWVSLGPRKVTAVISEHTTSTRAPLLFSAKSLANRRTVPPAKHPCWYIMYLFT
ncbi:hypothetical protein V8G54_017038 [Vigna mungo]|uniref:Uncharacterized protein n=1 Tax=Vigna mungo TaxID=3915 RepID=A0AAQ3NP23_VIGMU